MNEEIDAQKLELLRTALPKGFSAGDSGLGELGSKPAFQQIQWPQFTTSASESKLYNPSPEPFIQPQASINAAKTQLPWDIYIVESDENSYTLKVRAGTIAGILPTNWDDAFSVSGSNLFWGIADVSTDGFAISSVSIKITQNAPETQSPALFSSPSSAEIPFGVFQDGSSYNFAPSGNISISPKTWMILGKENPVAAGELPYDIYYTLRE
jgi:hypothetical protein